MERPRISVYVISYNQEDVIRRTMDSLVSQKDYLYEICINDDCSKDTTFEILLEYERLYPKLVKPQKNKTNLGICQNIQVAQKRVSGDVIHCISGDDVCPNGYFKKVLDYIEINNINWSEELFCIYGDYQEIEPDGHSIVFKNNLVEKYDPVKLQHRKLICGRSACYSKKILEKFQDVAFDRSYNAEFAQDIQLPLYTDKNYYIPVLGNIYYAGIGVSSKADKAKTYEHLNVGYAQLVDFLEKKGRPLDKKDLAFIEFMKGHHFKILSKEFIYFWKSIDLSLGIHGIGIDRIIFVFKKKLRQL